MYNPARTLGKMLPLLADPSLADIKVTWYRNGTRGHLHAHRYCYKTKGYGTESVTLSFLEASKYRGCRTCFSRSLDRISEAYVDIETLYDAQESLGQAKQELDKGTPANVNRAHEIARKVKGTLEAFGTPEHAKESVYTSLIAEAESLISSTQAALSSGQETILLYTRADIATTLQGKKSNSGDSERDIEILVLSGTPGETSDMATRGGPPGPITSSGVYSRARTVFSAAYQQWRHHREQGESAEVCVQAAKTAVELLSQLTELNQLVGVPLPPASRTQDTTEAVTAAWQRQVAADIDLLTTYWEALYADLAAATEITTVGIIDRRYRGIDDEVLAVVRAFPHARRQDAIVGNFPRSVAWWLLGYESGARLSKQTVSDSALETVATLWEPADTGTYADITDAARAASAL